MGRELEYKFRLTPEQAAAIGADYGPFAETRMETAYYDTPHRRLSAARQTLRRRLENGRSVCTVKTPKPDGSRSEWELECPSIADAVPELCNLGAPGEWETRAPSLAEGLVSLKAQGAPVPEAEGLTEICAARFTRHSRILPIPEGKAELALDRGVLRGTREEAPLLELELELKEGPDEALAAFAREFAGKYGLSEEPQSKFARASRLR